MNWPPYCGAEPHFVVIAGDPIVCDREPHPLSEQHFCSELGWRWWD